VCNGFDCLRIIMSAPFAPSEPVARGCGAAERSVLVRARAAAASHASRAVPQIARLTAKEKKRLKRVRALPGRRPGVGSTPPGGSALAGARGSAPALGAAPARQPR
jgi:hypothetical protein